MASNTYISGKYDGSAFEMKDAYISGYNVNSVCPMEVFSGGKADSTTVNNGKMFIFGGGTADSTTVNSGGSLCIYSGGTALNIKENGGYVVISGEAEVTFQSNILDYLQLENEKASLHSGTTANSATIGTLGQLVVFGGIANNTKVKDSGKLFVFDGTVNNATVNSGGHLEVSSGGAVNSATVYNGGHLVVSSGGTATNISAEQGARLGIAVASNTYISGTYGGSAFEIKDAYISGYNIDYGVSMFVSSGGRADSTTVNSKGELVACSSGTANHTTINSGGSLTVAGTAYDTDVNSGGYLHVSHGGTANNTAINSSGYLYVSSGGTVNNATVNSGGSMYVGYGGRVTGSLNITKGAIVNCNPNSILNFNTVGRTSADEALVNDYSLITGTPWCTITVKTDQASKSYKLAGNASNTADQTFSLGDGSEYVSITVGGPTVSYKDVEYKLFINSDQYLVLENGSSRSITITADSASKVYDGTALTSSGYTYTEGVLRDGDILTDVVVTGSLTNAGNAENLVTSYKVMRDKTDVTSEYEIDTQKGVLTVTPRDIFLTSIGAGKDYDETPLVGDSTVSVSGTFVGEDGFATTPYANGEQTEVGVSKNTINYTLKGSTVPSNYNIVKNEGDLIVAKYIDPPTAEVVTPTKPVENKTEVSLAKEEGVTAVDVGLAKSGSSTAKLNVRTSGKSVGIFNATCNYELTAKNTQNYTWSDATSITGTSVESAKEVTSDADGEGDIFFANANGTWSRFYYARNVGSTVGTWKGTDERVSLVDKNKICDVFTGSSDGNILALTDDTNGDALFVDDIYTAFPTGQKARLDMIDEIRAGAGDDLIDMTSQRFDYTAKEGKTMKARGGAGDDTLWASNDDTMLFGDAGNDRLVGGSGNDVIVGGIGNDSMHGGGGNDTFTFCNDWGIDTIEQVAEGGGVTLWFADAASAIKVEDTADGAVFSYQDTSKTSKVTVKNWQVADITVLYGKTESELYEYADLDGLGCFMAESSEKVFETNDKGVIAVI